ncbi:putative RDD family membrane protein YckC [Winogradskyella wandonensis]|uniref:Putative RDD family membrane protein YckC n=1 Tax=Winogradskyella wandonensis TaxID=1442586 RepID=A0A4R1KNN2_9FLAO|nr:RDD family protein [Winogradskyella wandonensis]TCK66665.1 putative RDD family membrane protein YckC [Winogradskyella wandonensis]
MGKLAINTAQNVNLDYKLIGLGERMVAFLIDGVILLTYMTIMENLVNMSQIFDADGWTRRGFLGLFYLPAFFYSLICHIIFGGRTIGKMIMKIKVVRLDGAPTQWYNLLVRWMLRIVDIWLFFSSIGVLSILLSERKQRVGDAAAGTVVISVKKKHKITSTILEDITDDYQPVFSNVTQLTDKDVRIVKEAFLVSKKNNDYKTLHLLRNKICDVLGIKSDLYDLQFIDTILKDYNYYTQNM